MMRKNKKKLSYGAPRVQEELTAMGFSCGKKRVANIMTSAGIQARTKKKWKATTNSKHNYPVADNLVDQNFIATRPNELWTSDITYIWTKEGWLYLCVILDVFHRKIIGWSMNKNMSQDLVIAAFKQAYNRYKPTKGVVFHSDRGSQFAAHKFRNLLFAVGFKQSMSRKGNCYDNAVTETFFKTLKTEHVYFENYKSRNEAITSIFEYIEVFYNRERRHSKLGYLSPENYEKMFLQKVA